MRAAILCRGSQRTTLITSQGSATLTAIVLEEWIYCDHPSVLAEYNLHLSVAVGKWMSVPPGSTQCELVGWFSRVSENHEIQMACPTELELDVKEPQWT